MKKVKVDSEVRLSTESAKLKKEAEDKITKIK